MHCGTAGNPGADPAHVNS